MGWDTNITKLDGGHCPNCRIIKKNMAEGISGGLLVQLKPGLSISKLSHKNACLIGALKFPVTDIP